MGVKLQANINKYMQQISSRLIARGTETKVSFVVFALFSILVASFLYGIIQDNLSGDLSNINYAGRTGALRAHLNIINQESSNVVQ